MPIHTNEQGWILETQSTGYAIGLNRAGLLTHRYWGARLPRLQDYPATLDSPGYSFNSPAHLTLEEYPGYEDIKFVDPCIKTTFADGVRDVVLRFEFRRGGPAGGGASPVCSRRSRRPTSRAAAPRSGRAWILRSSDRPSLLRLKAW